MRAHGTPRYGCTHARKRIGGRGELVVARDAFHVVGGRHPVVEAFQAEKAQHFVQNDCHLGGREPRIWVITGYVHIVGPVLTRQSDAN